MTFYEVKKETPVILFERLLPGDLFLLYDEAKDTKVDHHPKVFLKLYSIGPEDRPFANTARLGKGTTCWTDEMTRVIPVDRVSITTYY